MPFRTGENVGPYRIIQQLGQGGMATVFKAYHPALDRNVAIKVMHPAFLEDPQFLARFEREARVVASLDHPSIVPVYDFADHGGQPYLVMKYIEGQTLKAVLDDRKPAYSEILHIVKSVGAALSYAHRRGVLHRDIKPSNILLTADGQVYLADFGLARIAQAGQSSMSGDQLLGTPHYISPEQARGERDLDQGTDIYSLGIVLYQLTVGRVPFSADTPFSIIHDHIYTPLPLPRQTNPQLSEALEQTLLKALAKERADRFATVDELVHAFEASFTDDDAAPVATVAAGGKLQAGKPGSAASGSPTTAQGELPRRAVGRVAGTRPSAGRRWPWVLGGLGLSALCLLTFAIAAARAMQPVPPAPTEPMPLAEESAPPAIDQARAAVGRSPDDPQARLELAKMLEAAAVPAEAYQEYFKAGELYLQQAAYSRAADALLAASRLQQARGTPDPRLTELLTQALFLGAPTGDILPRVETTRELNPDFPGLAALEARARLFIDQADRARHLVEGVLAEHPEDPLAGAVMVDLLQADGKPGEARALGGELLARPRLPAWLGKHLADLVASLPAP